MEPLFYNRFLGSGIHTLISWFIFLISALLEVGGDAMIRRGLRSAGTISILFGIGMLGIYGLVVNMVKWDFSKLLGVYVSVFALISIAWSRVILKEHIPASTWLGITIIVIGGLIIQYGQR